MRSAALVVFAGVTLAIAWLLQIPQLHFGNLKPFVTYGIPILLAVGMLGGLRRNRWMIGIGWVGVVVLFVTGLLIVSPGEDKILGLEDPGAGAPKDAPLRILIVVLLSATQAACLRMMSRSPPRKDFGV